MMLFPLKKAVPAGPAVNPHALPEQSSHENIPYEQHLADQLQCRLLDLDFPAFALCLCRLLQALGYQNVHLAGRREWKGYNKPGGGGYDLEATLPSGLLPLTAGMTPRRVIVQIKQFDGLHVHQRSVDELRGTCLRVGAAEALLITTSAFSKVVRTEAAAPSGVGSPVAPVRLLNGDELIALLIRHRLGVKECKTSTVKKLADKKPGDKQWKIDDTFFAELALASSILSKERTTKRQKHLTPPNSTPKQNITPLQNLMQWRMTVRISSDPEGGKRKGHQKEGNRKGGD